MPLPRHIYRQVSGQRLFGFVVKNANARLLLSQIHYWDKKVRKVYPKREGWFWKTFDDWFFELGLSKGQVYTAVKPLLDLRLVERETRKYKNREVVWYRLNRSALAKALNTARADMKAWVKTHYQGFDIKPRGFDSTPTGLKSYPSQNTTPITSQRSTTTQPQKSMIDCSRKFFKNLYVPKRLGDLNLGYFFANSGLTQQTMQDILDITGLQAREGFKSNVGGFINALVKKAQVDIELLDISGARAEQRARAARQASHQPKAPPQPKPKAIPKDAEQQIQALSAKLAALSGNGLMVKVERMRLKTAICNLGG